MKKFLIVLSLVWIPLQTVTPAPITVEGYVVVAGSSRPLANVAVALVGPPTNRPIPPVPGTTDANGHFIFRDVVSASLPYARVIASAPGFNDGMEELRPAGTLRNVIVTLTTGGTIRGRITDSSGGPVAGVTVFLYKEQHIFTEPAPSLIGYRVSANGSGVIQSSTMAGGEVYLGQPTGGAAGLGFPSVNRSSQVSFSETDANGNYVLRRIPPSQYLVGIAFPVGYSPNPKAFATTYYPGVTDSSKARRVVVEEESNASGIDFILQQPARFTVSGTLDQRANRDVRYVTLHLPGNSRKMSPAWGAAVAANGDFEIPNVIPGNYELSPGDLESPQLPVDVRRNINGLRLQVPPLLELPGSVRIELRFGDLCLPSEAKLIIYQVNGLSIPVAANQSGPFVVPGLSSGHHFVWILPPAGYVEDVHHGNRDVLDTGMIDLRAGVSEPLSIVVRPADLASVHGSIPERQAKTRLARVLLVPDEPRRANAMLYCQGVSNSAGSFTLESVTPGHYKLFAWETGRTPGLDPYMESEVLARYEKYGVGVVVPPNGDLRVEASLIPR
jgi:hypothetical protein